MLRDVPKLLYLLYKRNGKIMREEKSGRRQENGRREGERRKERALPTASN